ncbi:LysR family transcriptional regulator [Levilactobacillus yonginensis]|uniref:LysR family transcriptional regulator n=1 Tax=Levilactobacillus yonginensis TaxID=1054041 RepID=UPI00345CC00E
MLENYLLEELVTFAQTGTLAETATQLNVTQPTVTRGMQKLESDLGVQLFDRQPNRLSLTPTGELATQEATALLQAQNQAVARIHSFDQDQRTLQIGTTLPGPLYVLNTLSLPTNVTINHELLATNIDTLLINHDYSLIFSDHKLASKTTSSQLVGYERLAVNLNKFMFQANQSTITFAELKDLSFIVLTNIGPWRNVIQQEIPNAKFLYQEQREAFDEITKFADFPYFSTNISIFDPLDPTQASPTTLNDSRVRIPISDDQAQLTIYANFLRSEKQRVQPLIDQVMAKWPD